MDMMNAVISWRFRPTLPSLAIIGLALLTAGACRTEPLDAPVRSVTPAGSWTAPSARQAADRDRALLRVLSALPGLSRVDVFVEIQKIASGVEYKSITPYVEVAAGRQSVRLRPAGLDTAEPLAEQTERLHAGQHYTVLIMPGEENGPAAALRVLEDPMAAPDGDSATLRVVHASADAGRLDVYMAGREQVLASGLEFQAASAFSDVRPSLAALELRPPQRTETMLRVPDLRISGGGMYTVVVIGRTRIEPPLETLVLEDRIERQHE
jgi:hypothetical protein